MTTVFRYVFCDLATGEIMRTLASDHDLGEIPVPNGQVVFQSLDATAATHYTDGKTLIAYTPGQAATKAAELAKSRNLLDRPDDWSNVTFSYVSPLSITDLKQVKSTQINTARAEANSSSFTFGGKVIASDPLSRSDIDGVNGYVSLTGEFPPGFPGAWKAVDNTYVPIPTRDVWVQFYAAMVKQGLANFVQAQTLKAQIAAATSKEELDAIQW